MDVQQDLSFHARDLDRLQTFSLDDGSDGEPFRYLEPPSRLPTYPQLDGSDWVLPPGMFSADMDAFANQPVHALDFDDIDWTPGPSNVLSSDTSCLDNEHASPSTATTLSQPTPGVSPVLSTTSDLSPKSRRSSVHARAESPEPTSRSSRRRKMSKASDASLDNDAGHKRIQERNRIAASKFRMRKRESAAQLRTEEEDVERLNQSLNANHGALVLEVQQLKMQLLQHSNCDCHLIQSYIKSEANRLVHSIDKDPKSEAIEAQDTSPRAPAAKPLSGAKL